jgi:myxalamid-type polyketide synthase MxaE and MxaD
MQYIEAHGTGTLLGDPIEAKALGKVLASGRKDGHPCAVGSVKTNIGHAEAAAGIAGLIKTALALKNRKIPASLHFQQPNPHIPFDEIPLRVQTCLDEWPAEPGQALAGVSSFGFGGTNAHVVLREATPPSPKLTPEYSGRNGTSHRTGNGSSAHLLTLSARSPQALASQARAFEDLLAAADVSLSDLCYTASARRSHHDYRLSVTGNSTIQLKEALRAYLQGEAHTGLSSGHTLSGRKRKLVFVFPGQGSQWRGMGRQLLIQEPVFREMVEGCDRAMRPYLDVSVLTELAAADTAQSRLDEVDVLQPALFVIQMALAALWRSWGVEPDAVVGHSMGEVAAACFAGALNLNDAAKVICCRSAFVKSTIGRGAMCAVELSIEEARLALEGYEDRVSIAVSNSPTSTVLSGDPAALAKVVDQLQRRDIFCRTVKVDFAAHSPQMNPLRDALSQALDGLQALPAATPIYSTVTGTVIDGLKVGPRYWADNLREPVLFSAAVDQLIADGHDVFLEISPHPILLGAVQQATHQPDFEVAALPSLRRDQDERTSMLNGLGALYSLGYQVDWNRIYPKGGRFVSLPFYPWQRERCWLETGNDSSTNEQAIVSGRGKHPLLGPHFKSADAAGEHFWEGTLDPRLLSYLDDHRIQGVTLLPVSAYAEMALAAATEAFGTQSFALKDVEFHKALFLPDDAPVRIQLTLDTLVDGEAKFSVYGRPNGVEQSTKPWTLHATGKVCLGPEDSIASTVDQTMLAKIRTECTENVSGAEYYLKLNDRGLQYGPFFQSIAQLWRRGADMLGEVTVSDQQFAQSDSYQLHPALVDACLQVQAAALAVDAADGGAQGMYMPTHIDEIRLRSRPGPHLWAYAHLQESEAGTVKGDVRLVDDAGRIVVEVLGLCFEYLGADAQLVLKENLDDWLYELEWQLSERNDHLKEQKASAIGTPGNPGHWLIFTDRGGVGEALAMRLEAQGQRCIRVAAGDSFAHTDDYHYSVGPNQPENYSQLFHKLLDSVGSEQSTLRGIVHLWSLDIPLAEPSSVLALEAAQSLGCNSVLPILQELALAQMSEPPRLWLVTQNAQAAQEESAPLAIAQAPLWGLGRVIASEHPTLWGGLVDLDPGVAIPDVAAGQLWREISAPDREDQIAYRQGRRRVARLVRKTPSVPAGSPLKWRRNASYLITGGLGALGLLVARWMVVQGARRVILLGRSTLPPRASWRSVEPGSHLALQIAAIEELEALGASVHLASVDVADEAQLRAFLDNYRAEGWPRIHGVVHAAGSLQDGLLSQLDAVSFERVMRPKVTGGWLLHRLLQEDPLDFFVLFSSAGSLLGQTGQGNYAASNSFLDALAHHRKAEGRPALSINWGAWAGLGFAESAGGKRLGARLALLGIKSLMPRQALDVLERLLRLGATQTVAIPVNWSKYREFYPAGSEPRLLSQLAGEQDDSPPPENRREKRAAIFSAEPLRRLELLQTYLGEQVARVLGFSVSRLDVNQPLSNLGLDSLMAVELKNRIAVDLGVNVPMVKFLQDFSVAQAASQVIEQLMAEASISALSDDSKPGHNNGMHRKADDDGYDKGSLPDIDQLSDAEVDSMLTDMLAKEDAAG